MKVGTRYAVFSIRRNNKGGSTTWHRAGETKALNVAWWRYRHGLSLQVRKVLP